MTLSSLSHLLPARLRRAVGALCMLTASSLVAAAFLNGLETSFFSSL